MKEWRIEHKGHAIRVESSMLEGRLYVDDKLQDESVGQFIGTLLLWGHLNGDGQSHVDLKIRLGGIFAIRCSIFVDDELVFSSHNQQ